MTEAGGTAGPTVGVHLPADDLRSFVTFYYFVDAPGPLTDFLYPEWGNVRFELAGDWRVVMADDSDQPRGDRLFGPTDRCGRVVTGGGRIAGFGLTPLGWSRLFDADASTLANRIVALGDALGPSTPALRAALADPCEAAAVDRADRVLADIVGRRPPSANHVVAVDAALRQHPVDVDAFAAAAGVSTRTLHRVCLRAFGFAPKRLLRRERFLATLGHVRTAVGDPLRAALGTDYCDQAHFYRDFRDFMGMSPRQYFTAARTLMAEAAAAQTAAGVTLSFELPPAS